MGAACMEGDLLRWVVHMVGGAGGKFLLSMSVVSSTPVVVGET